MCGVGTTLKTALRNLKLHAKLFVKQMAEETVLELPMTIQSLQNLCAICAKMMLCQKQAAGLLFTEDQVHFE